MFNTQLLANFLTEELNKQSKDAEFSYKFKIFAEIGEAAAGYINGIIRSLPGEVKPIKGYDEVKYAFDFDLAVPASRTNFIFIKTSAIVNKVIQNFNDTVQDFGTGRGIITFSSIFPQEFKQEYRIGDMIPLSVKIYITYTEYGAVTSSDKHWFFDGVEIPFLSESISVQTEGVTKKIATESYKKTLLTGQMRLYTFTVPHASEIGKVFQQLIFDNSIGKQSVVTANSMHKLKYYDGETFTEESPFVTTVTLYTGAKSTSTRPNASTFEITFTDADDGANYPKYYIGLIDFPFDNQSEDTRYFNSVAEQQLYFENKVSSDGASFMQILAPNLDNIDINNQIYPTTDEWKQSNPTYPLTLSAKNYAVIKVVSRENDPSPIYLYYFITGSRIGSDGQISFDLHLDTVQTYVMRPDVTFADCLIERAHLNRFQPCNDDDVSAGQNKDDYVKFVTDPSTKIYNAEDALNYPKRLVKRTKLGLNQTGIKTVDDWLNENVDYWVYVYLSPSNSTHNYNVQDPRTDAQTIIQEHEVITIVSYGNGVNSAAGCFCYPVCKNAKQLVVRYKYNNKVYKIKIEPQGRFAFENQNSGTSYYYNFKLSKISPFFKPVTNKFTVENGDLYIDLGTLEDADFINEEAFTGFNIVSGVKMFYCKEISRVGSAPNFTYTSSGLFASIDQDKYNIETVEYPLNHNGIILKNNIRDGWGTARIRFNPKLNGQNFRELVIAASSGDTFIYDIQKLQKDKISFLYTEPLSPEITKYYLRVKTPCGLYEEGTESNYMGLVGSNDTSIAFVSSKYDEFIANNKNFWMQSNLKIETGVAKAGVNVISNLASGNIGGAISGAVGSGIDTYTAIMDRNMTVDNMKNAPSQMKNANGNVVFNMQVTDMGLYVEEFSALDADLKSAFDFMELYGFSVNGIGDVKKYMSIRAKHNYVKAQIQKINGTLSNVAREDIRQRFAKGIRFWNTDFVSYVTENYESWLKP